MRKRNLAIIYLEDYKMTERKRLLRLITKNYIENALNEIEEIERKRKSCPKVELTNIELEIN